MKIRPIHRIVRSLLLLCASAWAVACAPGQETIYDLRCENLCDPLSVDTELPRLSWKTRFEKNGNCQQAYRILAATDSSLLEEGKADLWDSGRIPSGESVLVPYGGRRPAGNKLVYWKVLVWDQKDKVSAWSPAARFGTGLTEQEWSQAEYVGFPLAAGNPQCPLLRKRFEAPGDGQTTLVYVNSLGYHELYVNGEKVGDEVLAPAVSQLNKRTLYCTYDITPYIEKGENDLVLWMGQGWYRPGHPGVVYEGPLVKVRMETCEGDAWKRVLTSDSSWQAAESGYSGIDDWTPGHFGGERVEAALVPADLSPGSLDKLSWHPAACIEVPAGAVSPQMTEGNRILDTVQPVSVTMLPDGLCLVDLGQVLTGWFEIRFPPLNAGQEIVLEYTDLIKEDGEFYNQRQVDRYIASGKEGEVFRNKFNYHGFQYIRIAGLKKAPELETMSAYPICTDFRDASSFECSDKDMNAIHDMVHRTIRNLSLGGYMVDCTQLERLGYGGDGNASTQTAQTMFDLSPMYANWMRAWGDAARENGDLPHTAPNPYWAGGGPYWCGFLITASWRTYVNYGDSRLIEQYYPQMAAWLGFVEAHMVDGILRPWPFEEGFRNWYLGDWASPTGVFPKEPESVDLVDNCFISICYETMAKIADLLKKGGDAESYTEKSVRLRERIQQEFYKPDSATYATATQIDMTFPLLARVTPDTLVEKVTQKLFDLTENVYKGHLSTGLVGVPTLVEWAVGQNQPEFIYSMLKKREYPGYLYMIDNGATATWEHWNGSRSRSHNCFNGIGSWFYEALGGLSPEQSAPGYRTIRIAPQIPQGVTWAKTTKETPYGPAALDWKLEGRTLAMKITIPPGSQGMVVLPATLKEYTLDGKIHIKTTNEVIIPSGKYTLRYTL